MQPEKERPAAMRFLPAVHVTALCLGFLSLQPAFGSWLDPCGSASADDAETWRELVKYVRKAGGVVHDGLCLSRDEEVGLRGVFTSQQLEEGDVLISLPPAALLGPYSDKSGAGKEAIEFITAMADEVGMNLKFGAPVVNILFSLFLQQHLRAAEAKAPKAWRSMFKRTLKFRPFFTMLRSSVTVNIPMLRAVHGTGNWSALNGSLIEKRVTDQLQGLSGFHDRLQKLAGAKKYLPFDVPFEELVFAVAVVASRPVEFSEPPHPWAAYSNVLTPLIDLINHGSEPNGRHAYPKKTDGAAWIDVLANQRIDVGEEITFDYARGGERTLGDLFEASGFTVAPVHLDDKKLMERCVNAVAGFTSNLAALREAAMWPGSDEDAPVPKVSDDDASWEAGVGRVRDEEAFCARKVLELAEQGLHGWSEHATPPPGQEEAEEEEGKKDEL